MCVWAVCVLLVLSEHTAGQRKQMKQNTIIIFSYLVHRITTHAHKSTRLSAGTHSPHTPLQPRAVYASADAASSSGAHTHAELLRLPSTSRRRDGAWVVDTVGTSVVVVLGACVVVVVVGAFVVVVVVVVVVLGAVVFFSCSSSDSFVPLFASCPADRSFGSFSSSRFVLSNCVVRVVGFVDPPVTTVTVDSFPKGAVGLETAFPPLSLAITHTDEQQHRASTNRAHSRRLVIIIVSVVVQWCGADLHSEGHGEQQGR
ncbi:hypothetical protein TCDM_00915 [Trypanosoma cruzi Dm28c]|uniref:Uncharacterized protein n=1 Tax=Trypanosoma cruzi Dm28c TaxID=1416333 RepID=V5BA70_TRYCR|nr:hypothetical protein TCDM_00915 [Trypanosoma cruzi Dm28c]